MAAFALLGFAVAVYFTMWATGVGPVGSLVAQGVIEERDRVVLADFGNSTDDPGLGDVVTEALRVDLVQSPILTVADPSFVDRVLRRMGRDPSADLTPELAREVAIREGLKAVIQGEVAPAGGGSLLTASIVAADDGAVLAAFRETVDADGDVIAAIDGLSRQIREKAGESLPRIRAGEALTTVTTSSLDALRLYSEAMRLTEGGRPGEALGLLEEAVQLDTAFAMAWRKISALRSNASAPHLETSAAAARAYAHRDRLTERERYLAAAFYNDVAVGDLEAANRAYRSVLRLDPDEGTALNNLALNLLDMGRVDEARELLERAVDGPGETSVAHVNRMRAYVQSGDPASARRALVRARE
ncbi:MAG: tetratricopeptide repeat protein, partial [Gemmatimonadetes bacterium]|nr:tetratricopeptide repeat protein [Gemmatimonadota bacterium]NIR77108.1 tetratricopeptide repeat protein [Gemmatimonadota bacterium]NIT85626.1 tetratricopeptide repeat protein [Gemmatimonadota bacterium]NIU29458.1 tetratricopeptide repeat protein [Gemmatimonadota bacterium]NIU34521.1 tetratricopeptide repeat protein [Gemmatimonadota bacterium]